MKFRQIRDSLMELLDDAHDAEKYLEENPELQFARRTYIRSVFASIEGTIWILKDVCFNVKPVNGVRRMSVAEFALLKEQTYELKENGETKISSKFLRLPENIKFTYKTINKLFRSEIQLEVGSKSWQDFIKAIEIRNRITHPKNKDSFFISDVEIEFCKNAISWFNTLTHEAIEAFLKPLESDSSGDRTLVPDESPQPN